MASVQMCSGVLFVVFFLCFEARTMEDQNRRYLGAGVEQSLAFGRLGVWPPYQGGTSRAGSAVAQRVLRNSLAFLEPDSSILQLSRSLTYFLDPQTRAPSSLPPAHCPAPGSPGIL